MKWTIFSLACAALLANTGCCCSRGCSPCGAGYAPAYGATYAPSTCPGGSCGPMYQSGAATPTMQQAYVPYTSTASLNYLPAY